MKKILLSTLAALGFAGMAYAGDGTQANPYTVDELLEKGTPSQAVGNVYVQGYIVGSVDGQVYTSGIHFGLENASTTNIVIAGSSAETDANYAMPVQLPAGAVRNALNLSNNPDNLGHQVILKGSWEKYFGVNGFKSVTEYEWIGEAPTPGTGNNPGGGNTDDNTFLVNNMDGFTIDNVVLPDGISYVWAWDAQYGAKASAYANSTRYVTDSYLISPEITISSETPSATFSQALNYLNGETRSNFVNIYVREGATGDWTAIEPSAWPAGSDWAFVDDCSLDLSAYAGKTIQIGFRYQSNETVAPTWEVKRLKIGGTTDTPDTPVTPPTGVWTVAEALTQMQAGFEGEAQVKGYITQIDEISTSYGNATYYISDDTSASNQLEVFRGYGLDGQKFTSESELQIGALVIVSGKLVNYNGTFEFTTGSSIISYQAPDGPVTPPTPDFPTGENVTFDFTDPASIGIEVGSATEYDLSGVTITHSPVSISFYSAESASTKTRLFLASSGVWDMRFYKDTEFTVFVPEEYLLTGIEFNGSNLTNNTIVYSNGSISGSTWTPSSNTNTLTVSKNATGNNPAIKSMKVYFTTAAGVDEVLAADDTEAIYFNLQGQKVMNPEKGIFIKVVNGKAVKVIK